tara:strand:+ start:164 stop:337 length:174 start_codon:yes stop_codon:yes gene_type:complete
MKEFAELLELIDVKIKNNIKEGDYLVMMNLLTHIYKYKKPEEIEDDDKDDNDIYGSY